MASPDPRDERDEVLHAILPAIPPAHHETVRALLRPSPKRRPRKRPATRHPTAPRADDAAAGKGPPPSHPSSPTSSPPITPERALRIADDIIAAMRAAGSTSLSPLSLRIGPLPGVGSGGGSEVGGEGLLVSGGEGYSAERQGLEGYNVRLAVRPDREPLKHTVRLSDVAPEPLRWLWPGRIPAGKITVLDGDPGLGKTTLLCEVAARLSRGDALPGTDAAPGVPRDVLLFSAEDDVHDTIRPRIDAAGGDPKRILALIAVPNRTETGRPFALPQDLPLLDVIIQRIDAALVVFDPLAAYLRLGVSANVDQHVRHALAALKASAERTGAAIVVVRHLNKSPSANPLYRGLGSIGIIGAARSGLLLAADPDDPDRRVLAVSKGNLARPPASLAFRLEDDPGSGVARVVWEGESPWTAAELLQAQGQPMDDGDSRPSVVDEARAWLRQALAPGPRPARELRQEAAARGFGYNALTTARKLEGVTARKERVARGQWLWTLGDQTGEESALPSSPEVQTL